MLGPSAREQATDHREPTIGSNVMALLGVTAKYHRAGCEIKLSGSEHYIGLIGINIVGAVNNFCHNARVKVLKDH